ncbi:N-acetyltransferase [Altericroceibacterium endophyticum]|uniref:N-acetyltransferase n=1 Tax=Altericroceibacterium endophyticum TaxID=1808508 RepID=A0A6I4T4G6_9SPHN|nr:N-acetyltransferase [Altericroceibacterium endophyticum]MXO65041.1 N-acetyltransferase [Altericroceibacterium endophyticum]
MGEVAVTPVSGKRDLKEFIDCGYAFNRDDPNWVPPLRSEMVELLTPGKNPFFTHARVQLFLARSNGTIIGRISAHIDELALTQPKDQGMGPGTGNWGLLEADSEATAHILIAQAEEWLRGQGMTRVLAPISLSIWEEPGLLVKGHDHPPTVMMGHHSAKYEGWIESAGYTPAKSLFTYELGITEEFPPIVQRIIKSGEKNDRINIRQVEIAHFDREAKIIIDILNEAWSQNWGFVPFTETEKAHIGKKLKPLVREDLIMIAELDGDPVAFMITLPNANEPIARIGGKLLPFGWLKMLRWLRNPQVRTMRVPLMGVVQKLQSSRMASQLAFMMIEYIRRNAISRYGATRGEIGWILDDNQGMIAIADAINADINREYKIYAKPL